MEIDALYARLHDQRSSDRIVVTSPGKLFVPAEERTLDSAMVNVSVNGAGIGCPESPDWVVCHGEKALAIQFQQSRQLCPANVR
jgi:hypothetical protein